MSRPVEQAMLDMIRANVGDPKHPLVRAHELWTIVSHGTITKTEAVRAIADAREDDLVFRWRDAEGRWRYGLTDDGLETVTSDLSTYGPADADAFRAILDVEVSRADPDQDVVGWCNRRLREIEGGDSDE